MAEDLEHILSQLSQPDNAVIQQVMSEIPPVAPMKVVQKSDFGKIQF